MMIDGDSCLHLNQSGQLARVVGFHRHSHLCILEDIPNRFGLEWPQVAHTEQIHTIAFAVKNIQRFAEHRIGRSPPDKGEGGIARPLQIR